MEKDLKKEEKQKENAPELEKEGDAKEKAL